MKFSTLIASAFLFVFASSAVFSAPETAAEKPHWMLSETPAEVIVTKRGDELAKPRDYQAISTIVATESGRRVFVAWYGSNQQPGVPLEGINNHVMVTYGNGDLAGWKGINLVIRSPHTGKVRCSDPFLWREPSGRIWLAWTQSTGEYSNSGKAHPKRDGPWSRHGSTWAIYTDNPEAAAPDWSQPRRLFDGMMINKPLFLKNGGALFASVQFNVIEINDLESMRDGVLVWSTKDNAATFEQIGYVRAPDSPFIEPMMVEKNNGDIWMLMRRETGEKRLRFDRKTNKWVVRTTIGDGLSEAFSKDGGRTFGRVTISSIPGLGSRTFMARLASGNLLLVKNFTDDDILWLQGKPKQDRPRAPYRRAAMVAFLSKDDGKTWEGGLFLHDRRQNFREGDRRTIAYPDASQAADGSIYICWDFSRGKEPEISAAKVTEADILAGKIVSPKSIPRVIVSKGPAK